MHYLQRSKFTNLLRQTHSSGASGRISALFSSFQISFFLFDCKRWRFDRGGFDQIARSIELHVRLESKRPEREFITEFENVARQ